MTVEKIHKNQTKIQHLCLRSHFYELKDFLCTQQAYFSQIFLTQACVNELFSFAQIIHLLTDVAYQDAA